MSEYIKNLKTPIAIIGMGKSGEAAKKLLLATGITLEHILTFDAKLPGADFNDANLLLKKNVQTFVVSPGVPLSTPWLKAAKASGALITSELTLACSFLTTEKLIGVTGSLGKSTTVSLLGAGLEAFSKTSFVGGNLGTPFSQYALELFTQKRAVADWVVLELSSYQLENCEGLHLDYGAITFLSPNHLERYDNLEHYYHTKWKVLDITKNSVFINSAGGDLISYAAKNDIQRKTIATHRDDENLTPYNLKEAKLIGHHNQDNIALASQLALCAGWPKASLEAMKNFSGLSHRLENIGTINGVRYINDSKATAMDSVLIAVEAAHQTKEPSGTLFVLLGGRNKSLPWDDLKSLKNLDKIKFIFFGECREVAQEKSTLPGPSYAHLIEALEFIFQQAKVKDTVLLSPGGTSLDEFKSFEDRGNFFINKVREFNS